MTTNCRQLKMTSADGKRYLTGVADTEQLLRIIQSIPSPKAEPFKMWLTQVGRERIDETIDPELTIDRALTTYLKKGYSHEWINQHLQAIQVSKELTDERDSRGVQKGVEYAILTDEISCAWSGMTTRQYKNLKGLKKENLRDNMSTLELVLTMLAEARSTGWNIPACCLYNLQTLAKIFAKLPDQQFRPVSYGFETAKEETQHRRLFHKFQTTD